MLAQFIKKETLAQVFYYEFCKIFKNRLFYRTPLVAASVFSCLVSEFFFFFRTAILYHTCEWLLLFTADFIAGILGALILWKFWRHILLTFTVVRIVISFTLLNRVKYPSWQLLVQNYQCKHQNNVWNLFKVNNLVTRRRHWRLLQAGIFYSAQQWLYC